MTSSSELQGVLSESSHGLLVKAVVLPRAPRSKIVGIHDGALKIKLTKPPVDGAANAECCRVLARALGVAKSQISILQGSASRHKVLQISGIAAADAIAALTKALEG